MQAIYIVTVVQKIDLEEIDGCLLTNFGTRRCVGWFDNFDEANNAVENNFSNMHDDMFEYVVIEKIESGILVVDSEQYVYKWNGEGYINIETPNAMINVSNFGIG